MTHCHWSQSALKVAVILGAGSILLSCKTIYDYMIRPVNLDKYKNADAKGRSWCCITGSTDGIGLAIARRLCSLGFNTILIGRSKEKLLHVRDDLKNINPGVEVAEIVSDANDVSEENINTTIGKIVQRVNRDHLSIFVSNAGILHPPGPFENLINEDVISSINVNCTYPTLLLKRLVTAVFSSSGSKGRSLVIQTSSMTAYFPVPGLSVYSATKSFIRSMTLSLSRELNSRNVDVFCICPSYVSTKMTGWMRRSLFCVSSDECAQGTLRLATAHHSCDIIPNICHNWLFWLRRTVSSLFPVCLQERGFGLIKRMATYSPKN